MQGKTSITEAELDEADSIGMLILQEFSDRDHAETAEAALLRSRTYILVLRGADERPSKAAGRPAHQEESRNGCAPALRRQSEPPRAFCASGGPILRFVSNNCW